MLVVCGNRDIPGSVRLQPTRNTPHRCATTCQRRAWHSRPPHYANGRATTACLRCCPYVILRCKTSGLPGRRGTTFVQDVALVPPPTFPSGIHHGTPRDSTAHLVTLLRPAFTIVSGTVGQDIHKGRCTFFTAPLWFRFANLGRDHLPACAAFSASPLFSLRFRLWQDGPVQLFFEDGTCGFPRCDLLPRRAFTCDILSASMA